MNYKYRFHVPNYVPHSNGIAIIWEAAYNFSKFREVTISTFYHGEYRQEDIPNKYKSLISKKDINKSSTIVIYPDATHGNPLDASMVSRYMLAKEFILDGRGISYSDGDYLFSYSNAVSCSLDKYYILLDELSRIKQYSRKKIKGKISIYYGKCRIAIQVNNFASLIKNATNLSIITRTNPSNKNDLYKEIAESELLISFDGFSSLCYESTLLGTPVIVMDDIFKEAYENFDQRLHGFYYSDDISRINNIINDSVDLGFLANQELELHLKTIKNRTSEIIKSIESHFSSLNKIKDSSKRNAMYNSECLEFFIKKWKCSPILHCSSLKSVLGFHLLNAKPRTFFVLRSAHLFFVILKIKISFFIKKLKNIPSNLFINNYFNLDNEFKNLHYKINPEGVINHYKNINNIGVKTTDLPVIKVSLFKFKLLVKLLCI